MISVDLTHARMKLLIITILLSTILAQVIQLYARSLVHNTKVPIAIVDVETKKLTLQEQFEGEYCIGSDDIADSECISYVNGKLNEFGVAIYLDKLGNIESISLTNDGVNIHPFEEGVKPNLNPVVKNKPKSGGKSVKLEKVVQKKMIKIIDEDGNEIEQEVEEEVEVEVDERSFIQKNWVYIVIPLAMYMIASAPDETKEVSQEKKEK